MQEMQFDFDGLIQLLAHHLYSEKKVFIRELIQNAHDAIKRRETIPQANAGGKIIIDARPSELTISVKDDGIGMSKEDLENYLSNIGKSFTKTQRDSVDGLIGQFGIGFLSAFVVAKSVEVRTRKWGEDSGWLWQNNGSKMYSIEPCEVKQPGTVVTVFLRGEEDKGLIHQEVVSQLIRYYADMLTIPIYLNGAASPTNTMIMPWEKQDQDERQMQFNCKIYLEQVMFDSVLEVIPVNLFGEVNAQGVLYITKIRRLMESPRQIRVFQNRMFICDNTPEILPKWASFINGVINSPDLSPTAARDNFMRDEKADKLRDALGSLVISHLEKLNSTDPARFSDIQKFHNLGIKAACFYHDDFYEKFAHLIRWRTNKGKNVEEVSSRDILDDRNNWMTIPEILEKIPKVANEPQKLPCFTTSNSANQFFQMADAANSYVVDASWMYEPYLIEQYAKLRGVNIWLIHVDKEDDPNVYLTVNSEEEGKFSRLAEAMNKRIGIKGIGKIKAEVRKFKPASLSAVIRSNEGGKGLSKAQEILNDPNSSQDMRDMAMELYQMSRGANLKITINANSDLIIKLANQDLDNIEVIQIMAGVYNSALLMNQELMTPLHAKYFHDQFQALLIKNLHYLEIDSELKKKQKFEKQTTLANAIQLNEKPLHKIFFMITPFAEKYSILIDILRLIIEDDWGCQLFIASDKKYDDRILDNIRLHMQQADAFMAEISEANPNVMFELGAAFADRKDRPIIQLVDKIKSNKLPEYKMPADLHSMIYIDYTDKPIDQMSRFLIKEMKNDIKISMLLDDVKRHKYLPPSKLKKALSIFSIDENSLRQISEKFPTVEIWQKLNHKDLKPFLGNDFKELSEQIVKRIQKSIIDE